MLSQFGDLDRAPGVESLEMLEQRTLEGIGAVLAEANGGLAVIVAHDVVNRVALSRLVPGLEFESLPQPTGCWNRLRRTGGEWQAIVGVLPGDELMPGDA